MMMNVLISIIVPVYNGADYIAESLSSVLTQLDGEVEVIVVNDGSMDTTLAVISSLFANYVNKGHLVIFNQENQGVSAARNLGIEKARGRYIGFLDADDFVFPNYFKSIKEGIASGADIIEFGLQTFKTASSQDARQTYYSCNQFNYQQTSVVIDRIFGSARWYPWNRVFKSSLFKDIRFPVGVRFCEDLMTIPFLYEKSKSVFGINMPLYGYRVNPQGATLNVKPDYVTKLQNFYDTIPRDGLVRHDYLRMAAAYSIFSCNAKNGSVFNLNEKLLADFRHLRYQASTYRNLSSRRILMFLYPNLFRLSRAAKKLLRG